MVLNGDQHGRDWLGLHGYDKLMGARPMARLVRDKLKKPLANEILFGSLATGGGCVNVTVEDGELAVRLEGAK